MKTSLLASETRVTASDMLGVVQIGSESSVDLLEQQHLARCAAVESMISFNSWAKHAPYPFLTN